MGVGVGVCAVVPLHQTLLMTSIPPFLSSIILQRGHSLSVKQNFLRKSGSSGPHSSKPPLYPQNMPIKDYLKYERVCALLCYVG